MSSDRSSSQEVRLASRTKNAFDARANLKTIFGEKTMEWFDTVYGSRESGNPDIPASSGELDDWADTPFSNGSIPVFNEASGSSGEFVEIQPINIEEVFATAESPEIDGTTASIDLGEGVVVRLIRDIGYVDNSGVVHKWFEGDDYTVEGGRYIVRASGTFAATDKFFINYMRLAVNG